MTSEIKHETDALAQSVGSAAPIEEVIAEALDANPVSASQSFDAPGVAQASASAPIMDKDKFAEFMGSAFVFAGNLYAVKPPLHVPLQSLTRAPALPTARPAFDALHDMASKYSWLHWLIEEDADNIKALIVIGAFGAQLGQSIASETRQHRELIEAREREDERASQPQGQTVDDGLGVAH